MPVHVAWLRMPAPVLPTEETIQCASTTMPPCAAGAEGADSTTTNRTF